MMTALACVLSLLVVQSSAGSGTDRLNVAIKLEKRSYLLGEPVVLRVAIENGGEEPVLFLQDPKWEQHWKIQVSDSAGRRLPYVGDLVDWAPPRESEFWSLEVGASRMFEYYLSQNFDFSAAGDYAVAVHYDATSRVEAMRGKDAAFSRISALSAGPVAASLRIVTPEGREEEALARLFSASRRRRGFETCCWERAGLEGFLASYPDSAYAAYARFWLARAILDISPRKRFEQYELVKKMSPRSWLAAAAQLEIARTHERMKERAAAVAAYKELSEKFADSPFVQQAEDRRRALLTASSQK